LRRLQRDVRPPVDVDRATGLLRLRHRPVLDPPPRPGAPVRQARAGRARRAGAVPGGAGGRAPRARLMRVGHLGPAGTYSEEAALRRPGAQPVPFPTLPDTIAAVADGEVELAAVPVENSLEGSVGISLDTLAARDDVTIVGELVLPISVHLVARAMLDPADVEQVVSHPQPLAQCAGYLRRRLPQARTVPASSTAAAVRQMMEAGPHWAALGPRRAAELYGAVIVEEDVADDRANATRFVWIAPTAAAPPPQEGVPMRTSLAFWGQGD